MNKTGLIVALILAFTLVGNASMTTQAEEKVEPEDRDWPSYVYDGDTTVEMHMRCREAYDILEKRMQTVFDQLLAEIDDEADALAKQNQQDWQQYALSKRSFDADIYRGGSLAGPTAGVSYISELCRRIKELQHAIEDRRPN